MTIKSHIKRFSLSPTSKRQPLKGVQQRTDVTDAVLCVRMNHSLGNEIDYGRGLWNWGQLLKFYYRKPGVRCLRSDLKQ
jgi:hypothetical protein